MLIYLRGRQSKRRLTAVLAVGLLCLALAPGHASAHRAAAKVVITYGRWGSADEIRAGNALLQAFARDYPAISVSQQVADWNTYWTKLPTQMAAGQAPDAFLIDPGYYQVHYASTGRLVALDDLIKRDHIDMSQFWPQELPTFRFQGHYYELPSQFAVNLLLWNKTEFAKAGLSRPPSSWQELLKDGQLLTLDSKGHNATQRGFDPNHIVQWGYGSYEYLDGIDELLMTEMGGHLWSQPETSGHVRTEIDSPQSRAAIQFLVDLIYKYHISPTPTQMGHYQSIFAAGKVAMYIDGTFDLPVYYPIRSFKWDVTSFPSWNGHIATMVQGVGNALNPTTAHKEEAWTLIKWMAGTQGQSIVSANGLDIPSIRSLAESPSFLKGKPSGLKAVLESVKYGVPYLDFPHKADAFNYIITVLTNDVFTGHMSVTDGVKKAADGANAILQGRHV
ncbi:MAG TPA: extracellular solute-binding protein [Chloroflexota bacterium]|nr:extracellular solute-binding protein [Chloroflexota bacterium]HZS91393.1 extracellular solute-binding protein [Chloroflexota bacterium]